MYSYRRRIDYQLIPLGANLIDQYDADSYPTAIFFNSRTFYGVENLPYLYGWQQMWYRMKALTPGVDYDNTTTYTGSTTTTGTTSGSGTTVTTSGTTTTITTITGSTVTTKTYNLVNTASLFSHFTRQREVFIVRQTNLTTFDLVKMNN